MSKSLIGLVLLFYCTSQAIAQDLARIPWNTYILAKAQKEGVYDNLPKDTPVDVEIVVKDGDVVWYIEHHLQVPLDELSQLNLVVGTGMLSPESPLPELRTRFLESLSDPQICYKLEFEDLGEEYLIEGNHSYYYPPVAYHAIEATSADELDHYLFISDEVTEIGDLFRELSWLGVTEEEIRIFEMELFQLAVAVSAVTDNPVDLAFWRGFGEDVNRTVAFGGDGPADVVESQYTFCSGPLTEFFNAFEFKRPAFAAPPLDHATAAVYAENIFDALGVGVFANGASRGSYNQGQTGMLGLSIGAGNGAAAWGRVSQAPAAGGFKYGLLGEDQNLDGAFAAAIFGDGFYTGTWTQASDRRFKTQIRGVNSGLSAVMKLRPAQYEYVQDTPYNFPEGTHYGFIAQELEEVLPGLVSDVVMPVTLDPEEMQQSATDAYKTVNYIELIPILTQAIQELNDIVAQQGKEIARLNELVTAANGSN